MKKINVKNTKLRPMFIILLIIVFCIGLSWIPYKIIESVCKDSVKKYMQINKCYASSQDKAGLDYSITGDKTFIPITKESINDKTFNGITILQYVNTKDRTVWVAYEKFQQGYGISFTQEFDADGRPVLYDGDIDELITTK